MKGYIYITSTGYDPEKGRHLADPYLDGDLASLGACMPNIRKKVVPGDHIFVVSGKIEEAPQYVVGGFEVSEKMHAYEAYERFPERRLWRDDDGRVHGNIIVNHEGVQHPLDTHRDPDKRLDNYVIGQRPLALRSPVEVSRGRRETLGVLRELTGRRAGLAPMDLIGRCKRLSGTQIEELKNWLFSLKTTAT